MYLCIKNKNHEYMFVVSDWYTDHTYKPDKYWLHICNKKFKVTVEIYDYLTLAKTVRNEKILYIDIDENYCEFKDK